MEAETTSIRIGKKSDKKSLKAKLDKKAKKVKKPLATHIVDTLKEHGI